jgi:hypothetical protein
MINSIGDNLTPATHETGARRTEMEQQLASAIRRAEQRYRQVSAPQPEPIPSGNPPHLGSRVDIRI